MTVLGLPNKINDAVYGHIFFHSTFNFKVKESQTDSVAMTFLLFLNYRTEDDLLSSI